MRNDLQKLANELGLDLNLIELTGENLDQVAGAGKPPVGPAVSNTKFGGSIATGGKVGGNGVAGGGVGVGS